MTVFVLILSFAALAVAATAVYFVWRNVRANDRCPFFNPYFNTPEGREWAQILKERKKKQRRHRFTWF